MSKLGFGGGGGGGGWGGGGGGGGHFQGNLRKEFPKIWMLMYPDHFQNWLDFGHSLLIFQIWAQLDLMKRVAFLLFRTFSRKCMEIIAWNLACWCILTTFLGWIEERFAYINYLAKRLEGIATIMTWWSLRPQIQIMFSNQNRESKCQEGVGRIFNTLHICLVEYTRL